MTDYLEQLLSMGAFCSVYRRGMVISNGEYVVEAVIGTNTFVGVSDMCYGNAAFGALDLVKRAQKQEFKRYEDADYGRPS